MSPHQSFIDKLLNTFKRDIFQKDEPKTQNGNGTQIAEIAAKEKVIIAIYQLKEDYPAHFRQRKNVYSYLNKKLNLDVNVYDYDDTGENTILSLDPRGTQQAEYNYIIEKFTSALLKQKSMINKKPHYT